MRPIFQNRTMLELAVRTALACLLGIALAASAWAGTSLRGEVIRVAGGDVITLVDTQNSKHQLRLAFVDAPEFGQPFGDEAQSALAAMVLGRVVTANLSGKAEDGVDLAEVIEPHGHLVNLELVRRGLAWHDYFGVQEQSDRDRYQAAMAAAQQARQGLWSQDRLESPHDYRTRVEQYFRWWLYAMAGLVAVSLLSFTFVTYGKQIDRWIEKLEKPSKPSAEAVCRERTEPDPSHRKR